MNEPDEMKEVHLPDGKVVGRGSTLGGRTVYSIRGGITKNELFIVNFLDGEGGTIARYVGPYVLMVFDEYDPRDDDLNVGAKSDVVG